MRTVPLGEVAALASGGTPRRGVAEYYGEGTPWVSITDLNDGTVEYTNESLTPAGLANSAAKLVPSGTILVAMYGASIGKLGIAGQTLCTNQAIAAIQPDCNALDSRYLYHFLLNQRPSLRARGRGGAQPNISLGDLQDWPIPLPPLPEQRRIATVLDHADALRTKRRQVIRHLDDLKQSIFLDMFGDPVRNPKQWPTFRLEDHIASMQYGPRFYNESYSAQGVRIVRITDLDGGGYLDFDSMPRMDVNDDELHKYLLTPGDIVFARTGATVGKLAVIAKQDPLCIAGAYFIRIRLKENVDPAYVAAALRSRSIQSIIVSGSHQSAQQNFSGPGLRSLPLPLPPTELQHQFSTTLTALTEKRAANIRGQLSLDTLFASLQSRAFRGEL